MDIALKDLGPATIASMRVELNLPDEPALPPPVRKSYQGPDKSFNSTPIVQVPGTPRQSRKRPTVNSPTGLTNTNQLDYLGNSHQQLVEIDPSDCRPVLIYLSSY